MARVKKQTELPGLERPKHAEMDTLMEEFAAQASILGEARQRMGELNEQMLAKARELKLTTYRDETAVPPLLFTLTESTRVKVKAAKAAEPEDADESDDEVDGEVLQ